MTENKTCDVAILMGSQSDLDVMKPAAEMCKKLGLRVDVRVLSAHRTPEHTAAFVREATKSGTKVFIAGAGGATHLAGAVAAQIIATAEPDLAARVEAERESRRKQVLDADADVRRLF